MEKKKKERCQEEMENEFEWTEGDKEQLCLVVRVFSAACITCCS